MRPDFKARSEVFVIPCTDIVAEARPATKGQPTFVENGCLSN